MRADKNQRGVTLTELMVAVSIVMILAGTGMATFYSQLPHHQLKAAVREFMGDVWLARQQAATENRQYAVKFISPTAYQVVRGDRETLQQSQSFISILTRDYRGTDGGRSYVEFLVPLMAPVFRPDGTISSWDGGQGAFLSRGPDDVFFVNTHNEAKTVSVSRLGRIRVQ